MIKTFLDEYATTIIYAVLVAIAGVIGTKFKQIYEKYINTKEKKECAEIVVKAVEQLYQSLSGAEKLESAKTNLIQMLEAKGIEVSDIELDMLIESCVAELNLNDLRITKKASETDEI